MYYEKETVYKGIRALRYVTGDSFLNEIGPEHNTQCYCTDSMTKIPKHDNGCLYKGALDLTACQGKSIIRFDDYTILSLAELWSM